MGNEHRNKGIWRYILLTVLLFLVIGGVALAILNTGFDLHEAILDLNGKPTDIFYYEGAASCGAVPVGEGVAVVTGSGASLFDRRGVEIWSQRHVFTEPRFSLAEGLAAVWEFGGRNIFLLDEAGLLYRVTAEGEILSVTVSARGYLCVTTKETGYGGSVTVYNPNGVALYKWYSGQTYPVTACLKDGTDLLILTLGEAGSKLTLVRVTEEEPRAEAEFPDLVLDVTFNESGVVLITEDAVRFLSADLRLRREYDFSDRVLTDYAFSENYTALLLGQYQVGGDRTLVTVASDGTELGSFVIREEPISLRARRDAVALYTTGRIRVFDRRLSLLGELAAPAGCERAYPRGRSEVLAAGPYSAAVLSYESEENS